MDSKDFIPNLSAVIAACGGVVGFLTAAVALVNTRRQMKKQSREDDASLRTVTDRATSALIAMLQNQHRECQARLDQMERKLEFFERSLPVIQMRDQIMRDHIVQTGGLPRMPAFDWDALDQAARIGSSHSAQDVAG